MNRLYRNIEKIILALRDPEQRVQWILYKDKTSWRISSTWRLKNLLFEEIEMNHPNKWSIRSNLLPRIEFDFNDNHKTVKTTYFSKSGKQIIMDKYLEIYEYFPSTNPDSFQVNDEILIYKSGFWNDYSGIYGKITQISDDDTSIEVTPAIPHAMKRPLKVSKKYCCKLISYNFLDDFVSDEDENEFLL